jgi:hypothetical protein
MEPGRTQDYLGMEVSMDQHQDLFISMQGYTLKLVHFMEAEINESGSPTACPFNEHDGEIDTTPLSKRNRVKFQKALGCIGSLVV